MFQLDEGYRNPKDFTVLGDQVIFTLEIPDSDSIYSRELFKFDLALKTFEPLNSKVQNFEVFPNPTVGSKREIQIKSNLKETVSARLRLYDSQGKTIIQRQQKLRFGSNNIVRTPTLNAGIYFFNILTKGKNLTLRLVML